MDGQHRSEWINGRPKSATIGLLGIAAAVALLVGVGTAAELPGLEDMEPGSALFDRLAAFTGAPPVYFAAASDFEPGPVLANLFHSIDDVGRVIDVAVFHGVRNDIAVPTNGVWDPANPNGLSNPPSGPVIAGFPVPDDRRLAIGAGSVYWHCMYFDDQAMRDALVRWLTPTT